MAVRLPEILEVVEAAPGAVPVPEAVVEVAAREPEAALGTGQPLMKGILV